MNLIAKMIPGMEADRVVGIAVEGLTEMEVGWMEVVQEDGMTEEVRKQAAVADTTDIGRTVVGIGASGTGIPWRTGEVGMT